MGPDSHAFDISTCARPNILALKPYRCARDDYKDDGSNILLDANENAHGPGLHLSDGENLPNGHLKGSLQWPGSETIAGLNRYPDPHQQDLKQLLCRYRNSHTHTSKDLTSENLFVGVGSDEAIDILLRCFCVPGKDRILTCPPTYGMYAVSAQVNDLEIVNVPLDTERGFALRPDAINEMLSKDPAIKMVYLCSPGNPTSRRLEKADVQQVLENRTWNGVVVLDEAYIDFSPEGSSLAEWVTEWPNLVVMQTLSKAFGLAGIRLGAAFTSPPIARLLNNVKAPYNISSVTSALACAALQDEHLVVTRTHRAYLIEQRERMVRELPLIPGIGRFLGGQDSNFLLVEILDGPADQGGTPSNEVALTLYERLAETQGMVVRFRGKEYGCLGCLRITVGTAKEVDALLQKVRAVLQDLLQRSARSTAMPEEKARAARAANDVLA